MFTQKKEKLFDVKSKSTTTSVGNSENPFIIHGLSESAKTLSGNGAIKYSKSGMSNTSLFVDQFASLSRYKHPRTFKEINDDMVKLWSVDKEMTVKFVIYLRLITRQTSLLDGSKTSTTQRGSGLKHEGIVRMIWIAVNAPDVFAKNISLFISSGSWNDIIKILSYDVQYNGWDDKVLDWDFLGNVILAGIENPNTNNLVKKYLPQIKPNSRCNSIESQADNVIAKWICSLIFGKKVEDSSVTYKKYRKLKTNGTAHQWQQLISQGKHDLVNFDTIHGRALSSIVSGNYLKNQGLEEKYEKWISSKPIAKFVGYPHELAQLISKSSKKYQIDTINAQFNNLVEVAKKGLVSAGIRPISVMDCSGSMSSPMYIGGGKVGKLKSIELAFSSAIFFNEMMDKKSPFYNTYLSFSSSTEMHRFIGSDFVDKYVKTPKNGWGGTNFQSVFNFFVDFKTKNPNVDESLIPNFIVCFSDGEFDNVSGSIETNVQAGRRKLSQVFSEDFCNNFGICFVDLPNTFYGQPSGPKFETFGNCKNTFYFSGFELSPLGFLFGVEGKFDEKTGEIELPKTGEELFLAAMNQELLNLVTI